MAGFLDRAQRDAKALENLKPPKFLTDRDAGMRRREKELAAKATKAKSKGRKEIIAAVLAKRRPSQLDFLDSDDEGGLGPNAPKKSAPSTKPKARRKKKKDVPHDLAAAEGAAESEGAPLRDPNDAFKSVDAIASPPGTASATLGRQGGFEGNTK